MSLTRISGVQLSDCKTELVREGTIMVGELRRIAGRCGTCIAEKSLLLVLVLIAGCSEPPPPPVVEVPVPTEEPKVIELAELDNVVLIPAGQGELEVRVTRDGNKGSVFSLSLDCPADQNAACCWLS